MVPLTIKNDEAHALVRRLAEESGLSITEAVIRALREALDRRLRARVGRVDELREELDRVALECSTLPVIDRRPADEILGYDRQGLPS